jgi:DNA helicase-2/ATP-dependent DNA helicase PcrA
MLIDVTSKLNPDQQRAVNTREGHFAVLAGPGSGKTHVLVERYSALRKEGIPAEEILSLTFTNKAAAEMRKRAMHALMGLGNLVHGGRPQGFCTFHALGLAFAHLEGSNFPFPLAPEPLATPGQVAKAANAVVRRYPGMRYRDFMAFVSEQKRNGLTPSKVLALDTGRRQLAAAYGEYDYAMRKEGVLDFDDLLFYMDALLRSDTHIWARWQFRFVMVDESQDADKIQWNIVQSLSTLHQNVFAVGDCNQAIYTWRGAHPELFSNWEQLFPNCVRLYLGQNYRSSPEIVTYIKKVAPVRNELIDRLCTENVPAGEPQCTQYNNPPEEAAQVLKHYGGEFHKMGSTAILARTNAYLRPYEDLCSTERINYHLLGKSGFWQQSEVRNALAYCQCAQYPTEAAIKAALRAPFYPSRFIKKREFEAWLSKRSGWDALQGTYECDDKRQEQATFTFLQIIRDIRALTRNTASRDVEAILNKLKAREYYQDEEEASPDNNPVENLAQLVKAADRFETLNDFLYYARKAGHASRRKNGIALGTIHSAKGLEFNTVFVVGAQEGMIPHERATNLDEEARVFFVAVSRAARNLFVSYVGRPSRFLQGAENVKQQ